MNFKKEIRRCEALLKRELLPNYRPPIEPGFNLVVECLSSVKGIYSDAIKALQEARNDLPTDEDKGEIESKLQMAKNGYIAIDRAIQTIIDIRDALKLAPVGLSIKKVCLQER